MTRAVRRSDFPGNEGQWRRSVERRLRERFTIAASGPHEPAGVVTLTQILENPDVGVEFLNTDTANAVGPIPTGDLIIPLSRIPKVGSEQVFVAGWPIPRSSWTRTDAQLTIPGQPWFWTGMPAWVDYAYVGTATPLGPTIHDPGATTDTTPTITGTGAGGRPLQVWIDGVSVGTTTIASNGTWSITVGSALPLGDHTVTAQQTEPSGRHLDATPVTIYIITAPLTSLTLRGVDTTGALPAATVLGDFLVVVSRGRDYSGDPRLTLVSTNPPMVTKTWIGNASSLAALAYTGSGAAKVAAFHGSAILLASSYANGGADAYSPSAASMPGSAAVLALGEQSSYVSGTWYPPSPWVRADTGVAPPYSDGGFHGGTVDIFYWSDAAASATPVGAISASGGVDQSDVVVVSLQAP